MKAVIHKKYGSPDVLELAELTKPQPKEKELLIKVHATTVNRTDCAMLRATPFIMRFSTGLFKPSNIISGTDFAGVVEAVGSKVERFKVGDRVFGFDDMGIGSHAEFMTISSKNAIAKIPENISYEQAAASIEGVHYAYNFINKVDLKKGDKVIVNGGTGAIGSAMIQLVKYFGGEVTATCKAEHAEKLRALGALQTIDYTKEDFTEIAEKYDFVFDAVGKNSFKKSKSILKEGGTYISSELGERNENPWLALITKFIGRYRVKFPFPINRKASVDLVKNLMDVGKFNPLIDKVYSFEKAKEAFKYVEKGEKVGSVLIIP